MTSDGPGDSHDEPVRKEPVDDRHAERQASNDAWGAFGLMVSGVVIWGGAGYLVAQWTHHTVFTMIGLLLGMGTALYGVWFRYGRS